MVYVSGSSVKQQSDLHFDEVSKKDVDEPSQYGKRMGVLEINVGDDVKKEFHAGTSAGRSVFKDLNRISNTTDAIGAVISVSNGLVAEE